MIVRRLGNAGDTIVEVLLAIAVVSAVLGGAFVSADRSLNTSRQSQERGEALKLVEGQMEQLKAMSLQSPGNIFGASSFCFKEDRTYSTTTPCTNSLLGVTYRLTVTRDPSTNVFTVTANWDKVGGGSEEQLKMVHKMYPPSP